MANWKIEHDRPGCIACGACAAVSPDFWTMSEKDGKSDLVGSQYIEENGEIIREELELDDLKSNREAADCCPVNVIHLIDKKTGQRII